MCAVDEFSVLTGNDTITCRPCPLGGDCSGATLPSLLSALAGPSNGVVQQSHIVAMEGWWASPASDGLTFYPCGIAGACLQGYNGTRSRCSTGYAGLLCNACAQGYFEQYGLCAACPTKSSLGSVFASVGFPLLLAFVFGALFMLKSLMAKGMMKVGVCACTLLGGGPPHACLTSSGPIGLLGLCVFPEPSVPALLHHCLLVALIAAGLKSLLSPCLPPPLRRLPLPSSRPRPPSPMPVLSCSCA